MMNDLTRTHRCGSLRDTHIGHDVVVMGWVYNRRDHGGCIFIDLRDRDGLVQIVVDQQVDVQAHDIASSVRSEWVIAVVGRVRERPANHNPRLLTGSIEVVASRIDILSKAKTPPFQIEDDIATSEDVRLKYRYIDLRRSCLQRNLMLRHQFNQVTRKVLDAHGFLEIETPFLIKSTPEGARDYVVPSRVNPGQFFALPQSPQLFKQLLMISGYDRYFQITRCFRDEDLRAERQPEFTQVDLEMSFCRPEDVQHVTEDILAQVWQQLLGIKLALPFQRITYDDALAQYGLDAPDLRFGLTLVDLTATLHDTAFNVFATAIARKQVIKAINLVGMGDLSRSELDGFTDFVKIYGAKGLAWVKIKEDGSFQSPIAKFLRDDEHASIKNALGLKPGDVAVFVADSLSVTNTSLGQLRKHIAKMRNLIDPSVHRFCWVTDFPMFEWSAEAQRFVAAHHPFTSPVMQDRPYLESDPGRVKAQAYDIVLNGVEIGGGSIRIHDSALQQEVLKALGFDELQAQQKFGFLLDALGYGAPPHGGLALGVDRIMMQICQVASIRDVIAFPKTQKQTDVMLDAPAPLDLTQMLELSLKSTAPTT